MATPNQYEELVKQGRVAQEDTATFIFSQPQHITTLLVTKGFSPRILSNDGYLMHRFSKFYASLGEANVSYLKELRLFFDMREEQIYVNWPLIEACVERWNPLTHTFFFKQGEMTITAEAAEVLLSLHSHDGSSCARTSHCETVSSLFWLLRPISREKDVLESITRDDSLNLQRLWDYIKPGASHGKEVSAAAFRFGILLIMTGTVLFPQGKGMMRREHIALVVQYVCGERLSLAQPVLAHLISGLDSASMGNPFFGSPYLLAAWLERSFTFATEVKRIQDPTGKSYEIRKPLIETRQYFRMRFDRLHEGDVILRPPEFPLPLIPVREESESILVGGIYFVAYAAGRCIRQVGGDLQIPGPLSHIPRLESRDYGPGDTRRLKDVLVHWQCHTQHASTTLSSEDLSIRLQHYLTWVHLRAPDNLATLFLRGEEENKLLKGSGSQKKNEAKRPRK